MRGRRTGDARRLGRCAPDQRRPGHPWGRAGVRLPVLRRRNCPSTASPRRRAACSGLLGAADLVAALQEAWTESQGRPAGTRRPGRPRLTATAPNRKWLTDITENWTAEGKLYLCAMKDCHSNKIVGYAVGDRMKADARLNGAGKFERCSRRRTAGRTWSTRTAQQSRRDEPVSIVRRHQQHTAGLGTRLVCGTDRRVERDPP